MGHQRWRQSAAYLAVAVGGIASLATSFDNGEEVRLDGTVVVSRDTTTSRRFRVRTTAPSTTVVAEVMPTDKANIDLHVALVPDEPSIFGTASGEGKASLKLERPASVSGIAEYRFSMTIDGTSRDVSTSYEVSANTGRNGSADFGLELIAE